MLLPAILAILAHSSDKMSADFGCLRYLFFDRVYLRYFFFSKLYWTGTDFNFLWLWILLSIELLFPIFTLVILLVIIVILLVFFLIIFDRLLRTGWKSRFRGCYFRLLGLLLEGLAVANLGNLSFRLLNRLLTIDCFFLIFRFLSLVLVLKLRRRLGWLLFRTSRVI